jgi:hypothetical protein
MKASVEPSKPSATTAVTERNKLNHGASSKTKRIDSAKKRPTGDESDDASVIANLAHPAKKSKVDKPADLTRAPIRRSGKTNLMLKDAADKFSLETMIFQVGSEAVTHKPGAEGDSDVEEVEGENDTLYARTPRQQDIKQGKATTGSEGPYETPVVLRTKLWAPPVQVDDTEAEESEFERVEKIKAARVSSVDIDALRLIVPYLELEETTCRLGVSTSIS